jgi:hypothetical protein
MSRFTRRLTHRAIAYRATVTRDEFGGTVETWVETAGTPAGLNARPHQGWSGAQQDHGPGEQQGAMQVWFLHPGFDVAERDVLDVVQGVVGPVRLRVESVTPQERRTPGKHHIEVNVEVWQGDLAEPEAAPPDEPEVLSVEF